MKPIRVHALWYEDRKEWLLYYHDPNCGFDSNTQKPIRKRVSKKTGIKGKGPAEKSQVRALAENWENELNESRSNITWKEFRERYEDEVLSRCAVKTDQKAQTVLNSIERILAPKFLKDITADAISRYEARLREKGNAKHRAKGDEQVRPLSGYTIASNLSCIRAFLNWARKIKAYGTVPEFCLRKDDNDDKPMKGRPITEEEFDRMLKAVPKVVGKKAAPSWVHFLQGLWWSGLRLGESLELYWDQDNKLRPILNGNESQIFFVAALQKNKRSQLVPMAPEFAEFLDKTPKAKRHGPVFMPQQTNPDGPGRRVLRVGLDRASHIISEIGKKARVVVDRDQTGKVKYASAHDLRRSFGTRWSNRVMPPMLKRLMRHTDIKTTMRFYVDIEVRSAARALWNAYNQTTPNANKNANTSIPKRRKSTT